jgi:hypothetical protein
MRNQRGLLMILVALFAITPAYAQLAIVPVVVTGAGTATFGSGAVLSGVSLSTMRFGVGVDLPGDGTASGDFQATLIAASRRIVVEGKPTSGSTGLTGTTFSGTCSLDLGDGSAITAGVPFTVSVATPAGGTPTLALVIGTTTLPAAPVSAGAVRVK